MDISIDQEREQTADAACLVERQDPIERALLFRDEEIEQYLDEMFEGLTSYRRR